MNDTITSLLGAVFLGALAGALTRKTQSESKEELVNVCISLRRSRKFTKNQLKVFNGSLTTLLI
jgi:hypothetical protein